MKKLFFLCGLLLAFNQSYAQCVPSCTAYAVTPITYTSFPVGNVIPTSSFTVPISASANAGLVNADDGMSPLIPIGFTFMFYCTAYTDLWVCTNGFLQFNNGSPAVSTGYVDPAQIFPDPTTPNAIVSLNMTDLDLGLGGSISYTTVGVSPNQIFILTFSNVPIYGDLTSPNTGQILLYETSNLIEIYTGTVINNSSSSSVQGIQYGTQGIENSTGTLGTAIPGRNKAVWSASNSAYQFSPFSPAPPPLISGPSSVCSGLSPTYSVSPVSGATSYNWLVNSSWIGTSTTSAYSGIVGSSATLSVTANYTCGASQPATIAVTAIPAPTVNISFVYPSTICSGNSAVISVNGATDYTLDPGGMAFTGSSYSVFPNVTTEYTLVGTDNTGCLSYNSVMQTVSVNPTPQLSVNDGTICAGDSFTMYPIGGANYVFSNGSAIVTPPVGMYSYTINSTVDGCSALPVVCSLTVYSMPNTAILLTKTVVCKGDPVTLRGSGAQNYQWNSGSAPTASINVVTPNTTGTLVYTLTGTNNGGCAKNATVSLIVDPCVGIDEFSDTTNGVVVYPNPSNGDFTLKTSKDVSVVVYDIEGKIVFKKALTEGVHAINLTTLPSGQYLMKTISENKQQNIVLIKQ